MRLLIGNLSTRGDEPIGLKRVARGGSARRFDFERIMLIDSGLLTHDEIDCLRPWLYEATARGELDDQIGRVEAEFPIRFVKVHDAYTMNPAGEPLLGGSQSAQGAILIVRDPRDVALSLAHHMNSSIDDAIKFMDSDDAAIGEKRRGQDIQLRQNLRCWSGHAASWLDQTDIPVHLVRYEDLRKDTAGTFRRALAFAGLLATEEQINQVIASCDFTLLRQQEQEKGFNESPRPRGSFFRRGKVGSWRNELSREQVVRIESCHEQMMLHLGYEPAYTSGLARAG
jgi:hypothetical protein